MKRFLVFLLLISAAFSASAQLVLRKNPLPESPQASEMTRYGTHNVNLYAGRITVNIPVGTYKDSDFEIPVSLNYIFNGFRTNEQASEAGLGWTLACGGIITREIRGIADEERGSMNVYSTMGILSTVTYPFDNIANTSYSGYTDDVYVEILTNQFSKDGPANALFLIAGEYYDAQPDVYHFNFLGHSGSFVRRYDGTFDVFDTGGDILYKVEKTSAEDSGGYNSYYSEICITTGDGYKYIFGGGVDHFGYHSSDCFLDRVTVDKESSKMGTIVAWRLNCIQAPGGRELFFDYETPCSLRSFSQPLWMSGTTGESDMPSDPSTDTYLLTRVSSGAETVISFNYDVKDSGYTGLFINGASADNILGQESATMLLTEIACAGDTTSLSYKWNPSGNPYPFLEKISINSTGSYRMEYNGVDNYYFPHFGTQAHDHWGYLNRTEEASMRSNYVNWSTVSTESSNYEETLGTFFAPNYNASQLGMMTHITYPTGGCSEFTYEANTYSKAVRKTYNGNFLPTDDSVSGYGPGGRIHTIINKDSDGTVKNSYTYSYTGFNNHPSGRLLVYPRHRLSYAGMFGNELIVVFYATTGNLYRAGDVVVEYPCVTETCSDGSKTEYEFTDWSSYYDTISSGDPFHIYRIREDVLDHLKNVASIWNVRRILTPLSKMDAMRGKPLRQKYYAAGGVSPVKTVQNTYSSITDTYYEYLNVGDDLLKVDHYSITPQLLSTTETTHYTSGDVQFGSSKTYNNYNQVTSETTTRSDGASLRTVYTYPSDYPNNTVLAAMAAAGVNGYPVTVTNQIKESGSNTWVTTSATRYTFAELTNCQNEKMYLPVTIEKQDVASGVWKTEETISYDEYGNVAQSVDAAGTVTAYTWYEDGRGPHTITQNYNQPDARTWTINYIRPCLPSSITGPDGITKNWEYDAAGRLIEESESGIGRIFNMVYSTKSRQR